jgi:hypothetical protein
LRVRTSFEFILDAIACVLGEASLRGRRHHLSIIVAAEVLVFIKDYRALVLRRGDLHHIAS